VAAPLPYLLTRTFFRKLMVSFGVDSYLSLAGFRPRNLSFFPRVAARRDDDYPGVSSPRFPWACSNLPFKKDRPLPFLPRLS